MSYPLIPLGQLAKFINGDRGKNYPSKDSFVDIEFHLSMQDVYLIYGY